MILYHGSVVDIPEQSLRTLRYKESYRIEV